MKRSLEVLNDLVREGIIIDYSIGGAMGATFYLEPVLTMDLDVFVLFNDDESNLLPLQPIYKALADRGYFPDDHERECINIEGTPVQFLPAYNALLQEALAHAKGVDYMGTPTKVLSAEHLVAISVQTGRTKDHLRVLAFMESGTLNMDNLREILVRYELIERWRLWTASK
jgi:hypothetical protein